MLPFVVFLMESAPLDTIPAPRAVVDSVSLTSAEHARLSSLLRNRFVRVASRGTTVEVGSAEPLSEGLAFDRSDAAPLPNPIPWSQVDTVWTLRSRKNDFLLLGAALGGVVGNLLSDNEGSEFGGLGKFNATLFGAVAGATVGGFIGYAVRTWRVAYPIDPKGSRGGWSVF